MKDIPMARALGVCDVHADYGCKRTTEHYELLRAVSHWTDEDIAFEKSLERSEASAKISDFSEIRRFF